MIEELVFNVISNAPAVVVLVYLVYRLDQRLEEMLDTLIDISRGGAVPRDFEK